MIYTPHHLSTLLDKAGSVQCSPSRKCYRARAPSTFLSLADKNDNAWNFRHRAMNWLEMEVAKNQENQLFMER